MNLLECVVIELEGATNRFQHPVLFSLPALALPKPPELIFSQLLTEQLWLRQGRYSIQWNS